MTEAQVGGWSDEKQISPKVQELFDKLFGSITGIKYELLGYYEQIVEGVNYSLSLQTTISYPDAKPHQTWLYFHVGLDDKIQNVRFESQPPK